MSDYELQITFDRLLSAIRDDLKTISKLCAILESKINGRIPDEATKTWITDIFLDKAYELEVKMREIYDEGEMNRQPANTIGCVESLKDAALELGYELDILKIKPHLADLENRTNNLIKGTEYDLSEMRQNLRRVGWWPMSDVHLVNYVSLERRRYVKARDELSKAKENAMKKRNEDVMNYLRTAIDLSIKERFGFKKILFMNNFFKKAEQLGFPLPSYTLIYNHFSEGSQRLHSGKIHTDFEVDEAIRTVSNFIDSLELMEVTKEEIKKFADECNCVEI